MKNLKCLFWGVIVTLMFVPSVLAQGSEPAEGEILYRGAIKLEKCDEAVVSFILCAGKDSVRYFAFEYNGVYVKETNGNVTKRTTTEAYPWKNELKGGVALIDSPYQKWKIDIQEGLGSNAVTCVVKFFYIEDLGTVTVVLNKVEPKQE